MTPKEKARDLYLKMLSWQNESHIYIERNIISISAKRSALIAVDEILNAINPFGQFLGKDYWQEVKQEIELL